MGARRVHGTTIQVWPSGRSYEYRGDPDGPAGQRRLRKGHYQARLQCRENCRRMYLDLLSEADQARYIAELGENPDAPGSVLFPTLGKYITPAEGDDWTTGGICPTCSGEGYTINPVKNPWRRGTAAEWREVRIAVRAENYHRNLILCCDSALISALMGAGFEGSDGPELREAFGWDSGDLCNLYPDPGDWAAQTCREWLRDHGVEIPDPPAIECEGCHGAGTIGNPEIPCGVCRGAGTFPDPGADDDDEYLDMLRGQIRDNAEAAEVYEWWRVDSWLGEQLRAIGEVVLDNGYGVWWGRQCSGQGLIQDGTLQRVAANFERGES